MDPDPDQIRIRIGDVRRTNFVYSKMRKSLLFYDEKDKFWQPTYDLHPPALGDRVEERGLGTHLTPAH